MNEINKNKESNFESTLNYEFTNSLSGSNLAQKLKSNQGTKESELEEEFAMEKLNLYLMSKQYKEAIKFIEKKGKGVDDNLYNYLLFDIKIKCFFKIIKNKLSTYKYRDKTILYSPDMKTSIILEKMYQKMIIYFKEIIDLLYIEECNEQLKEKLLQNYCEGLYLLAKFHKIKNKKKLKKLFFNQLDLIHPLNHNNPSSLHILSFHQLLVFLKYLIELIFYFYLNPKI